MTRQAILRGLESHTSDLSRILYRAERADALDRTNTMRALAVELDTALVHLVALAKAFSASVNAANLEPELRKSLEVVSERK